jgi:DNA polymerase III delta subunit
MKEMPSPVLILGDPILSQKNVNSAKKKYNYYKWVTCSFNDNSLDEIRMIAGQGDFFSSKKAIILRDLPNKKDGRSFIIDLVKLSSPNLKFIIWDSENIIKVDSKTKTFNKTWMDFINELKAQSGFTIVNNGGDFDEKDINECVSFIKDKFNYYKINISQENAILFCDIVGKKRSYITTEISKIALTSPKELTREYILENVFASSSEAILYKLGNVLDSYSYSQSLDMLERFKDVGIHPNVLAELMIRKARWQLIIASLWKKGLTWNEIPRKIMNMGKFPSMIWQDNTLMPNEKKKQADGMKELEDKMHFMTKIYGLKEHQFHSLKKAGKSEAMPMEFMAKLACDSMRRNIVSKYTNTVPEEEIKKKLEDKMISNYLSISELLKSIRYGETPMNDLHNMVLILTNPKL